MSEKSENSVSTSPKKTLVETSHPIIAKTSKTRLKRCRVDRLPMEKKTNILNSEKNVFLIWIIFYQFFISTIGV